MGFFDGWGNRTNRIVKGVYRGVGNTTKSLGKGLGLRSDGKFMTFYKQIKMNESNPEMLKEIRSKLEELYNVNKQRYVTNSKSSFPNYGKKIEHGNYYNRTFMEKPKILMVYIDYLLSGSVPSLDILNKIRDEEGQISDLVVRNIEQKENMRISQNLEVPVGGRRKNRKTRKNRK